jgi:hypothetical protein
VAREILACALEVTDGTEAREKLRAVVRHMLPTAVDETGMIDWVERAEPFLFGGTANGNDPRSEALYSNLGDLCRAGKEKALREMGREVRERVEAALANRGTK